MFACYLISMIDNSFLILNIKAIKYVIALLKTMSFFTRKDKNIDKYLEKKEKKKKQKKMIMVRLHKDPTLNYEQMELPDKCHTIKWMFGGSYFT